MHFLTTTLEEQWVANLEDGRVLVADSLTKLRADAEDVLSGRTDNAEHALESIDMVFPAGGSPLALQSGASLVALTAWTDGAELVVTRNSRVTEEDRLSIHRIDYSETVPVVATVVISLDQLRWMIPALQDGLWTLDFKAGMRAAGGQPDRATFRKLAHRGPEHG